MLNVNSNSLLIIDNFSNFLNSLHCIKKNSTVGVAVSSGVDSMSLLHLSDIWAKKYKKKLFIISYDHNLRKESIEEINHVKKISRELGWEHKSLKWQNPSKKNVLENARNARYSAISKFCKKKNIDTLLLGHHLDDLIETFSIRILKKSGIDGLCPMTYQRKLFDLNLIRPFLQVSKNSIYSYASLNKILFYEDPTNKNTVFLRTKIRMLLENNQTLKYKLSKSVVLFCRLKKYFESYIIDFLNDNVNMENEGYIILNKENLLKLPEFLNLKVLNLIIQFVGNKSYPLRTRTLLRLSKTIYKNNLSTFSAGGCLISHNKKHMLVVREFNQIRNLKLVISKGETGIWDKKFLITNLSKNYKIFVTSLGQELKNKLFAKFYNSEKKNIKKLPFSIKKTLPVIKTLEGLIYIPHLNIYNDNNYRNLVKLEIIDYYSICNKIIK